MDLCGRLSRMLASISVWLGGFLLLLNVSDVIMGVTLRYFGGAAPIWTEELARFSMVWMVLIGAAAAFYNGDQMSIDFVVMKLPPRGKAFCRVLSVAVRFIVLAALIWFGARNVIGSWKMKTMALGVPKSIPLMAVPIGMGLLLATILFKAAARKEGERK
jgi:TRAP-type C4-dicarboxylate transport system permease small subunit